MPGAQWRSG